MPKQLVVMPVHGMGKTERDYDDKLRKALKRRLGSERWSRIAWHPAYYQDLLQVNQERMLRDMRDGASLNWVRLRRFLLFGFSDAAGMEAKPQRRHSTYEKIQASLVATLDEAFDQTAEQGLPVVVVAHSLGCQVISNFLWDAQRRRVDAGIFRDDLPEPIGKTSRRDRFRRLKTLSHLFTTGCNIPIFIAGLPKRAIRPILVDRRGWHIRWENYYDKDDVLGWPLKPICPAYARAVAKDRQINAGGSPGSWLASWTPLSHRAYWQDDDFLRRLARTLRGLTPNPT